jgi:hypothetical protein
MTRVPYAVLEFDTFSAAVGLALITGALALVATYLLALTATLAALAAAGWTAGHLPHPRSPIKPFVDRRRKVALLVLAAGAGAFFLLPPPIVGARGLALAASFLPLWWVERTPAPPRSRIARAVP